MPAYNRRLEENNDPEWINCQLNIARLVFFHARPPLRTSFDRGPDGNASMRYANDASFHCLLPVAHVRGHLTRRQRLIRSPLYLAPLKTKNSGARAFARSCTDSWNRMQVVASPRHSGMNLARQWEIVSERLALESFAHLVWAPIIQDVFFLPYSRSTWMCTEKTSARALPLDYRVFMPKTLAAMKKGLFWARKSFKKWSTSTGNNSRFYKQTAVTRRLYSHWGVPRLGFTAIHRQAAMTVAFGFDECSERK